MSNDFNSEFVALVCPNCGAPIKLTKAVVDEQFMQSDDGRSFVYIGTSSANDVHAKCEHCDTEFVRRQKVEIDFSAGTGTLNVNTGGGAFIAGKVTTKGDFVGRDKTTVIYNHGSGAVAQGNNAVAAGAGALITGTSQKKKCGKCGTKNPNTNKFCSSCGAKL